MNCPFRQPLLLLSYSGARQGLPFHPAGYPPPSPLIATGCQSPDFPTPDVVSSHRQHPMDREGRNWGETAGCLQGGRRGGTLGQTPLNHALSAMGLISFLEAKRTVIFATQQPTWAAPPGEGCRRLERKAASGNGSERRKHPCTEKRHYLQPLLLSCCTRTVGLLEGLALALKAGPFFAGKAAKKRHTPRLSPFRGFPFSPQSPC